MLLKVIRNNMVSHVIWKTPTLQSFQRPKASFILWTQAILIFFEKVKSGELGGNLNLRTNINAQ